MKIAIDGPAASGKSTVSKEISDRLGYRYIDTGAMYRALTLLSIRENIGKSDEPALIQLLESHSIEVDVNKCFVDGEDVSKLIRTPDVTERVSYVCAPAGVRERMVRKQQNLAKQTEFSNKYNGVVMEGRDISTVVLPDADLKIFMTASPLERARRRQSDPKNPELEGEDIEKIAEEIARRDKLDSEREVAPLKPAEDSIIMDTTGQSIQEVVDDIISKVNNLRQHINQKENLHGSNA
ncbi:MAG: (d)CMP kinase [Candidatus Zixiibacteriota bacterium]